MATHSPQDKPKIALIMSGGGARAAYQVGVLKAIAEMLPSDTPNPFPIICGTSAGAINSAALAIYGNNLRGAVRRLMAVWVNFHVSQVFRADTRGVLGNGLRWLLALFVGGLGRYNPRALLDRAPLRALLERYLPCDRIQESIDNGHLEALCITASGYTSSHSVSFYQGVPTLVPWRRTRRMGCPTTIGIDHLMASSAIPFVFESVKIHREYFGDGSMRQIAPLSPAIHLGADRILVIGVHPVSNGEPEPREATVAYPSIAQIAGHVLSSIFLDALEADMERLRRINETLRRIPSHQLREHGDTLRPVDTLMIAPSVDLGDIAERHKHHIPRAMRFLLAGLGAYRRGGSDLVSYLLFERPYCQELIEMGYQDAMRRGPEILHFLGIEAGDQAQSASA